MSLFQRLSEGNGRKPLRPASWPTDICEQLEEVCVEPFTWKLSAEEALLPGPGFSTATENVPAEVALPVAVSFVEETNVVARAELLNSTCAPERKLEPVTVRVKPPRFVEAGEMPVRTGVGLRSVTALEEDFVESAELVAVMVIVLGEGRVAGAV